MVDDELKMVDDELKMVDDELKMVDDELKRVKSRTVLLSQYFYPGSFNIQEFIFLLRTSSMYRIQKL